ncbi:hypothetical protein TNCV_4962491 [Trichonephila clavipes]|nr:hypothetical protein TNCV_4962491 [Trichonephila clavipes]
MEPQNRTARFSTFRTFGDELFRAKRIERERAAGELRRRKKEYKSGRKWVTGDLRGTKVKRQTSAGDLECRRQSQLKTTVFPSQSIQKTVPHRYGDFGFRQLPADPYYHRNINKKEVFTPPLPEVSGMIDQATEQKEVLGLHVSFQIDLTRFVMKNK